MARMRVKAKMLRYPDLTDMYDRFEKRAPIIIEHKKSELVHICAGVVRRKEVRL